MPSLERLHKQFKDDEFVIIAVDVGEKRDTVKSFIDKKGYSFLNLLDKDSQVSVQYGVRSHPMKFIIDKKGDLIGMARGFREWDSNEMKDLISLLINS